MPSSLGVPVQAASKSSGRKNFIFLNNCVDDVNTVCLYRQLNSECCFFILRWFVFLVGRCVFYQVPHCDILLQRLFSD